jgi:hypothetical protein
LRWIIYLLIINLALMGRPAAAQSGLIVRLSAPSTDSFPAVKAYLDVRDAQGKFLHNLQPDQLAVLEEGASLPVEKITELQPGAQVVVAINPGPVFAIRNFQAVSRYDMVKEALANWAKSRLGSTTDDWSLIVTSGPAVSHTSDPAKFLNGLDSDQVDTRIAQPSIDTLASAVALASDPTSRPGMGRAILFITSPIDGDIEQALQDISDQARTQAIPIHIWLVASSGALTTQSTQKLMALAGGTGGQVFTFSGEETLPNPEEYLDLLRHIYQIEYQSKVGLSGEHEFAVQVRSGEEQVQSNPQTFKVELEPPAPAFVAPPIVIERQMPDTNPDNGEDNPKNEAPLPEGKNTADFLFPKDVTLQVVFDFPDGRKRDLVQSALLVDGVVIAENQAPPFDQFTWGLESYTADGIHVLQVNVTDELGLTGTSIEVPVQVSVERLEADPLFVVRRNLATIAVILAVLAGSLLFLILVLGGQLRPVAQRAASFRRKAKPAPNPISMSNETSARSFPGWGGRFQRTHQQEVPNALAYLNHVSEADNQPIGAPIPITSEDVMLGSDPKCANLVLDDACIEGCHARLARQSDGSFRLFDQGSIAGTWVNYTPITQDGAALQHGDIVHFGRIGFHFTIRQPAQVLKPSVTLETEAEVESSAAEESEEEKEGHTP